MSDKFIITRDRAPDANPVTADAQWACFRISEPQTTEWWRLFERMWNRQAGPRASTNAIPIVYVGPHGHLPGLDGWLGRGSDSTFHMNVKGHTDVNYGVDADGEKVGAASRFLPMLQEYIDYTNAELARIQVEDANIAARVAVQHAKRVAETSVA